MDAIPVLSQIKSAVQAACKDLKGAKETQINFSRRCPVVSHIRSAVEAGLGDRAAAEETQKECGRFLLSFIEGIPVVGHGIGTGYYIAGKKEKGDTAMKSASRTSGVILGGVGGFFVFGIPGSVAGGTLGGVAMDGITTGIDSAVHKQFRPQGILVPFADRKNPGKWVDAVFLICFDTLSGYGCGKLLNNILRNPKPLINPANVLESSDAELKSLLVSKPVLIRQILQSTQKALTTPVPKGGKTSNNCTFDSNEDFPRVIVQYVRDGVKLYKAFEKTELGGVLITVVSNALLTKVGIISQQLSGSDKSYDSPVFSKRVNSLSDLSNVIEDKNSSADIVIDDKEKLEKSVITFDEIVVKGRKQYVLKFSKDAEYDSSCRKPKLKRSMSCYF